MDDSERRNALLDAMWAGDLDALGELAPCECCCGEHTSAGCAAREWGGCRSGLRPGETDPWDEPGWREHYRAHHGMTDAEFYCTEDTDEPVP